MPTYPVFCGKDCGGNACPMLAVVEDGVVTRLINNPAGGPYYRACSRGFDLALETYAPDRIVHPLVRNGPRGSGQFRRATWEEALSITADRLGEIRQRYGATAVMNRGSAGVLGAMHATWALLARFLTFYGGYTQLTGGYSSAAASYILPYLFGPQWTASGFDASTMQEAEMIILWGANVLETRQGVDVPQRLMEARKRGAQVVVIDPRRSATVRVGATWWLPCRPGTDAALMLAMLHVLVREGLVQRDFVAAHSVGFEQLEAYVMGAAGGQACSPQWAEALCGVPAPEIERFARAYAAARPAMLFPGYSIQRVFAGEEPYRLAVALQLATGNFGQRGGSTGSMNSLLPGVKVGQLPIPPSKAMPRVPVTNWPDAILQGRAGGFPSDIHAVYNMGANTLNQGGDIHKAVRAFEAVDFVVSHEIFMTPTARWSDVILPAATSLEKEDIGIPWQGFFLLYKPQISAPRGQARSDYDILCDLAQRLGFGEQFSGGRTASQWIEHFIAESDIPDPHSFRESGIYLPPDPQRPGLAGFTADPARFPLGTPSGRVEIASQRYHAETGFPAIPTWQEPPYDARYPLRLITPKSPHRTHSQGSNIPAIRGKAEHALEMHPADADARGIAHGGKVRLFNQRGAACLTVHLTEDLVPGVVCLKEGIWFELDENGVDQAGAANIFTATQGTEPGKACIMHAVGVEVAPEQA